MAPSELKWERRTDHCRLQERRKLKGKAVAVFSNLRDVDAARRRLVRRFGSEVDQLYRCAARLTRPSPIWDCLR